MVGSAEEYERLCLSALRKASEGQTDYSYHHERAAIFASLAMAAAAESGGRLALPAGPAPEARGGDAPTLQAS